MSKSPAFRFYPSDFMSSPDVQAMDLQEVGAFILLLGTAWLSERHGYLPDDEDRIRRWARMTPEQWTISRRLLLSKFPVTETGWRSNARLVSEAGKQAAFSESQRQKITKRWKKQDSFGNTGEQATDTGVSPGIYRESSENTPALPFGTPVSKNSTPVPESDTRVIPSVSVSVFKEKTCSDETAAGPKSARKSRSDDPRHELFKTAHSAFYRQHNAGRSAPWDGKEGKRLKQFLAANPQLTLQEWQSILRNRAATPKAPLGLPLSAWISSATAYVSAVLNEFGRVQDAPSDDPARHVARAIDKLPRPAREVIQ